MTLQLLCYLFISPAEGNRKRFLREKPGQSVPVCLNFGNWLLHICCLLVLCGAVSETLQKITVYHTYFPDLCNELPGLSPRRWISTSCPR